MPVTASAKAPLLQVSVAVFAAPVIDGSIGPVLVPFAGTQWPERWRRYDGSAAEVRTAMIADGFDAFGEEIKHVERLLDVSVPVEYVLMGRRVPADATWEQAIAAIMASIADAPAEANQAMPKYLSIMQHEDSVIAELFAAATAQERDMLPIAVTPSADVRSNAITSLEKTLKASNLQGVLMYYDSQAVTSAAEASATTTDGPWAIPLSSETSPPSASAQLNFDDGAGVVATFEAEPGVKLGSASEPFDCEPGWVLAYERDFDGTTIEVEIDATAAAVVGTVVSTDFDLADGMPVAMVVRGNAVSYNVDDSNYTVAGTYPPAEVAAEMATALGALGTASGAGNVITATDAIRGTSSSIGFVAGTSAAFAAAIGVTIGNVAQGGGNVANVDATIVAELAAIATTQTGDTDSLTNDGTGKVQLSGLIYGTGGNLEVKAAPTSTALFLTALGITAGSDAGAGDCADSRAVTPAELFTVLDADWAAAMVTNDAPDPTVSVSGGEPGSPHYMRIQGDLAEAVGLAGTFLAPGNADEHPGAAWLGQRAGINHDAAPPWGGCLSWNDIALKGVTGERKSFLSIGDRLVDSQDVNYAIRWTPARGGEAHAGVLLIRHTGGATAYVDQWEAAQWIAKYSIGILKAAFDQITDSGGQVPYQDASIRQWLLGQLQPVADKLTATQIIASSDLSPPAPNKPTGLTILRKDQLAATERNARYFKAIWTVELSGALHGGIVQVNLNV